MVAIVILVALYVESPLSIRVMMVVSTVYVGHGGPDVLVEHPQRKEDALPFPILGEVDQEIYETLRRQSRGRQLLGIGCEAAFFAIVILVALYVESPLSERKMHCHFRSLAR